MSNSNAHAAPTRDRRWIPYAVHVASLALAFAVLMYLARHIWFIYDEWEFISRRIVTGQLNLFAPHNEHWSTVPILIFKGLFGVFGARTHVPYMATVILFHLGIATMLWYVMRRSGADPVIVAVLTLLFLFLGAGHDNILWAIQISTNPSVLLGLVHLVLADHDGRFGRRDVAGWVAGTLALMSSGVGLPMLAAATVVGLLRRGVRGALVTASVPALVYAWWMVAIGYHAVAGDHISISDVLHLPVYVWTGLTATLDGATGLAGAGAVLVLGLLGWALSRDWPLSRQLVVPLAAATGALAMFAVAGLARNVPAVVPARYIYVAAALLTPLAAVALTSLARRGALLRWGPAALIGLMAIQGAGVLRAQAATWHLISEQSRQRILGAAQLLAAGAPVVGTLPDPNGAPDVTTDELRTMVERGDIRGEAPAGAGALQAAALMQVRLAPSGDLPANPTQVRLTGVADARLAPSGPGCVRFEAKSPTARLDVEASALADLTMVPDLAATVLVDVQTRRDLGAPPFRLVFYPVAAGVPAHLDVANPTLVVTLTIPTSATICGAHA
jgi:hypothetical protein